MASHHHHLHRPPVTCPVCGGDLHTTRLGCPDCGTGLTGEFESCRFCSMTDADRDLLEVFLKSRGNMKAVERHLDVSYPTARSRFDEMLGRLGLGPEEAPEAPPAADEDTVEVLRRLAAGEIDVDSALGEI